ncbi:bifunctional diguanylate cyclase/phosphodiesterase [Kushneria aurantia]|uniref:PAS domain S-box protein n=1 Tax=Kushneria aurantia TaxID=504092 RepID=A0ABV6G2U8_9GAMM|nr:bifunctional diguanylate cyclase/phosphodiesterase [Kushneria aurantia]
MTSSRHDIYSVAPEQRALNTHFAVALFDADFGLIRANRRYLELFGDDIELLKGHDEAATFVLEAEKHAYHALRPALESGEACQFVSLRVLGNGHQAWIEADYMPLLENGELVNVAATYTDVTHIHNRAADDRGQISAINASQLVMHLSVDGSILEANSLFLEALGYREEQLIGLSHDVLVSREEAAGDDYHIFWQRLRDGEHCNAEFRRVGQQGNEVWLQASYNPIIDPAGRVSRIVQYATDITSEKLRQAEYQWQIAAINKSQAVIVFDMYGTILEVNDRFLKALGYERDEVVGQHHRIFVVPSYAHSIEYSQFWKLLRNGQYHAGQYQRLSKDGEPVWLQATYNPIFDMNGRAFKVVKYASIVTEERAQQTDHQGQIAAIHKSQAVVSFALDGTIIDANDNFLNLMGYRYAEVRGQHHMMFVDPADSLDSDYRLFWERLARGEHQVAEFKRLAKGGREVWLQATYNPIFDMNGRPFKVVKYATDITAEKRQQADYRSQIEAINRSQGVVELGLDGTILSVNDNFLATLCYQRQEVEGRHHSMLVMPGVEHTQEYADLWSTLRSGTFHSGMFRRQKRDGGEVWLQATYNPVLDFNGKPYKIIKFASDVSANVEMARAHHEASRLAQHDATTALPNRLKLAGFMTTALPHPSARLAVLYIDLDRFRAVNDALGYRTGDCVLGEVADRLRRSLEDDQMVARFGADEFVVAAPGLEEETIETLCRTLLARIGEPIQHQDGQINLTASIGIAISPADGTSPDDLLKNADIAMQRARRAGRATYSFFAEEMNARITSYRIRIDDIRRGIANQEFVLEYQPRFDTHDRRVLSVEALVRWLHPEKGLVGPGEFIDLAERSGLIIPLGEWILNTACRTIAAQPHDIGVSVNISPVQFRGGTLLDTVEKALARSGLAAERLELEITESVLLDNPDEIRPILQRIKSLGVRLAIDDFGTGHSSLSYLRSFPFDVIKIDRQFISDMVVQDGGRAIVHAILSLGKALGLGVIAEGVETEQQFEMLASDECKEVQGFLLARPMPAPDLGKFLDRSPIVSGRQTSDVRLLSGKSAGRSQGGALEMSGS